MGLGLISRSRPRVVCIPRDAIVDRIAEDIATLKGCRQVYNRSYRLTSQRIVIVAFLRVELFGRL